MQNDFCFKTLFSISFCFIRWAPRGGVSVLSAALGVQGELWMGPRCTKECPRQLGGGRRWGICCWGWEAGPHHIRSLFDVHQGSNTLVSRCTIIISVLPGAAIWAGRGMYAGILYHAITWRTFSSILTDLLSACRFAEDQRGLQGLIDWWSWTSTLLSSGKSLVSDGKLLTLSRCGTDRWAASLHDY